MSETQIQKIADEADMIVRGYAFTKKGNNISILNLNRPDCAMLMTQTGKMLESSMDDMEQAIVMKIWREDSEFMEVEGA